ncbi:hypothetical protein GCM10020220_012880 [Nonomuraea rubra]
MSITGPGGAACRPPADGTSTQITAANLSGGNGDARDGKGLSNRRRAAGMSAGDEPTLMPTNPSMTAEPINNAAWLAAGVIPVITAIVFGIAAVSALEITLLLALCGLAGAELGAFMRRHPQGPVGGMRDLAAEARQRGALTWGAVQRRWKSHSR